jgi:IrrE N-terminal-like domain
VVRGSGDGSLLGKRGGVTSVAYGEEDERARVGFVRELARQLLAACDIRTPPVDLRVVIAHLGITYCEANLPPTVSAYCCEHAGTRYAFVNRGDHPHRQRFSLAHEIGHFELFHGVRFLLREPIDIDHPPVLAISRTGDPREREANMFAGELLVPLAMLKKACVDGINLERLGGVFVVSQDVLTIAVQTHWRSLQTKGRRR